MTIADDAQVENALDECLEELDRAPGKFTPWEIDFLNKLEASIDELHPSSAQVAKLAQIHAERVR